ncbi:MAG: 50S ribosomal protein L16 [Candidatus Micrarchaeota archaeon]|nr:50S ribosomal protein L16 [Candidatus Micrarchaeota archaeon]
MGLRPAHTCRGIGKVCWTRFSRKKPRKSYVKALPHNAVQIFNMGDAGKKYEMEIELIAEDNIQLRDSAIEAGRQAINKYLEKQLPANYYFKVLIFPHNVIRENKMIVGAGADRLQKGMRKSFGRPSDRAARVKADQKIFIIRMMKKDVDIVKEAIKRVKPKLSGAYYTKLSELS